MLEVGAGSGYQAAVLAQLARAVYAVELRPELAARGRAAAARRSATTTSRSACFDGTYGWRERAPFDAILVAAGAPEIPPLLVDQLADGGRLVIPVGPRQGQRLAIVTRRGDDFTTEWATPCSFVDLVGKYGWGGDGPARA